jgi:hypothetical protein
MLFAFKFPPHFLLPILDGSTDHRQVTDVLESTNPAGRSSVHLIIRKAKEEIKADVVSEINFRYKYTNAHMWKVAVLLMVTVQ